LCFLRLFCPPLVVGFSVKSELPFPPVPMFYYGPLLDPNAFSPSPFSAIEKSLLLGPHCLPFCRHHLLLALMSSAPHVVCDVFPPPFYFPDIQLVLYLDLFALSLMSLGSVFFPVFRLRLLFPLALLSFVVFLGFLCVFGFSLPLFFPPFSCPFS